MTRIINFKAAHYLLCIYLLILFASLRPIHSHPEIIPRIASDTNSIPQGVHRTLADDDEEGGGDGGGGEAEPEAEPEPEPNGNENGDGGDDEETTSSPSEQEDGGNNRVTTCGGILQGLTGEIAYKVRQSYENNERCTWTIFAPDATTLTFTLEENGFIQKEDNIKVSFFNDLKYKTQASYKEVSFLHNDMNKTVSVPGPVAYVRFFSDTKIRGLGFRITYVATDVKPSDPPCKFTNRFYNTDFGNIQFTSSTAMERASFNIKPTVDIALGLKYFSGNCAGKQKDALVVYNRGRSPTRPRLEPMHQCCNSSMPNLPMWKVTALEEILITFQTDDDIVTNTFQLIWAPS